MTSSLHWEPRYRKTKDLSDELKFALRKQYGEPVDTLMDVGDINYLLGLDHAGIKDATFLIEAINKHQEIEVKEIY